MTQDKIPNERETAELIELAQKQFQESIESERGIVRRFRDGGFAAALEAALDAADHTSACDAWADMNGSDCTCWRSREGGDPV